MKASEGLRQAAALLEAPGAWTKHTSAKNIHGHPVGPCDDSAVSFCSIGAMHRVFYADSADYSNVVEEFIKAKLFVSNVLNFKEPISAWNDHPNRTQQEVIELFIKAAKLAEDSENDSFS